MAYEAFIGWRYLFRRERKRAALVLFLLALGAAFLPLIALRSVGLPTIGPIVAAAALVALVFGLLCFFSVFTTVAILGVVLGVAALVVVLSVTSGFQEEFKDKVLGVNAHVIIMKYGPDFSEYPDLQKKVGAQPGVIGVSPFVFNEMQAAHGTTQSTVYMKGIDLGSSLRVLNVGGQIIEGSIEGLRGPVPSIVLGRELAKKLRAHLGDTVKLLSPLQGLDPSYLGKGQEVPHAGDFKVVGIFFAGFDEYDRKLVFLNLSDAQRLVGHGEVAGGVEVKLANPEDATRFARSLEQTLGGAPYRIIDWEELNHNLFTALRMQKFVISLFLTIIIIVAAFNIVASLTMIVVSKEKEIAILKSMGAKAGGVARVFQVAGLTIGAAGVCAGIGYGLLLCFIIERFGYPLDPKIYLIATLPVHIRPLEVCATAAVTLAICFLATIYPALKASGLEPVEGLRYE